jgi:hypothetical protein
VVVVAGTVVVGASVVVTGAMVVAGGDDAGEIALPPPPPDPPPEIDDWTDPTVVGVAFDALEPHDFWQPPNDTRATTTSPARRDRRWASRGRGPADRTDPPPS